MMKPRWLPTEKRSLFPVVLLVLVWLGVCSGAALAAPSFQAAGAADGGTKAIDAVWPAHAVGDIALLIVATANQPATLSTPAGFVEVPNSPQGTGSAGGSSATRLTVFWARATSTSMAAPRVADSGNNQVAQIVTFRGAIATGNPWDVTAGNVATSASTGFTIPGATTTVANTLVIAIVTNGKDSSSAQTSGWTNAQLSGLTERTDVNFTSGNGGGFGVATGVMASVGNYGSTTGNLANSSVQGRLSIALKPPALLVDDDKVQCPTAGYTTIAAALAAASTGDTISVCPGTYSETVAVSINNLTIRSSTGNRNDVMITSAAVPVTLSALNATLKDMTVTSTGGVAIDSLWSATGSHTFDNLAVSASSNGIHVANSSANTFSNLSVNSSNGTAILLDWNADGAHIFQNVTATGKTGGINAGQGAATFSNVTAAATGASLTTADAIYAGSKYAATFSTVTATSAGGRGIHLGDGGVNTFSFATVTASAKLDGIDIAKSGIVTMNGVSATSTAGYAVVLEWNADAAHIFQNVTATGFSGGLNVAQGAATFSNITATATDAATGTADAIYLGSKYAATFSTVTATSAGGRGIYINSGIANPFSFTAVTVSAKQNGIHVAKSGVITMSGVTVASTLGNAITFDWDADGAHSLSTLDLTASNGYGLYAARGFLSFTDFKISASANGIFTISKRDSSILRGEIATTGTAIASNSNSAKILTVQDVTVSTSTTGIALAQSSSANFQRVCVNNSVDGITTAWNASAVTVQDSAFSTYTGSGVNIGSNTSLATRATVKNSCFNKTSTPRATSNGSNHLFNGNYWQGVSGAGSYTDGNITDSSKLASCPVTACYSSPVPLTCVSPIDSSTFASDWYTRVVNGAFAPSLVDASGNACSGTGCRLRLTDTGTNEATQVSYIKQGFPFGINKVTAEFDYWSYGGSGADGIAIAFSDPANPSGNNPPTAGGFGGSLGYANRTGVAGFTGGWVGVGLDEYGNYANPTEGRTGTGTGSGYQTSSVAIRGASGTSTNYTFLAGNNSWSATASNSGAAGQQYRYRITLDSSSGGGSTAVVKVERDTTGSGNSYSTQLNYTTTDAPPSQLQLTFTGSTGASTNKHEIANLQVCYQAASALPPLNTGSVKPDSFNCVASGADALTGHLYTKLAGTAFNFDVVAIKDGAVATTYAADADKPVTVELVDGSGTTACASRSAINPAVSSTLTFTQAASATDKGRKAISMTVGKAYPDLRCRVTDTNQSPSKIACSSDDFAVRPTAVTLSTIPAMATPPSASSANPIKAGTSFTLQAATSPSDNYSGALTQDTGKLSAQTSSQDSSQQSGGVVGTLTPSSLTANAVAVNSTYSEVGYLYLAAGAFRDDAFTAVDSVSSDCVTDTTSDANLSDSLVGSTGKYGCSIGNKTALSFGRFIPDHFDLSVGSNGAMSAFCGVAGGFTYTGQPMGYLSTALPALTIKPMNAATGGAVTQNYQGVFQRLAASGVTITLPTADSTQLGKDGTTKTVLTATMNSGTLTNSSGTMTYTLKSNDQFTYTRDANALVGAYTTAIPLAVTAASDGEVAAAGVLPTMKPSGVSLRFGRLWLGNVYGSENLNLSVPFETQYWNGFAFVKNGGDNCTSLVNGNIAMDNLKGLSSKPGINAASILNAVAGAGKIILNAPSTAGSVDLVAVLGSAGAPANCASPTVAGGASAAATYLSGKWCGASYDRDPTARATFGVFGSSLRKGPIYIRENF